MGKDETGRKKKVETRKEGKVRGDGKAEVEKRKAETPSTEETWGNAERRKGEKKWKSKSGRRKTETAGKEETLRKKKVETGQEGKEG